MNEPGDDPRPRPPRPIGEVLRDLGLEIDPPLRVAGEDVAGAILIDLVYWDADAGDMRARPLQAASCLACRKPVWVLNWSTPPVPFNLPRDACSGRCLIVHVCSDEDPGGVIEQTRKA